MKLLHLILLLMAIQMSLFVFVLGNIGNSGATGPYNESSSSFFCHYVTNYSSFNDANQTGSLAGVRYSSPDLWSLIFCPAEGNSSRMIWLLIQFGLLMGALGFFAYANRSDISLLAIPFLFMLGAGAPTIVQLYSFINSEVSELACGSVQYACFAGQFFAILVAGPLMIMWVLACFDWYTGRQTS